MTEAKIVHTSPNLSESHLKLRMEVEQEGFDPEILRNFLWLVNAHDKLIALPRICRNVIDIVSATEKHWHADFSISHFTEAIPILQWITANAGYLGKVIGADFDRQPKTALGNPIIRRGSTRHPLYTTLWHTHRLEELQERYLLLQGHLLYAHALQLLDGDDRKGYENHADEKEWKGIPNSPYAACLTAREFRDSRYANVLEGFAVKLNPVEFAASLNALPQIENKEQLQRLFYLRDFLQKSSGLKNWVNRPSGSRGEGRHATGHIDSLKQLHQMKVEVCDSSDAEDNWGSHSRVTDTGLSQKEQQEILSSDLLPEEFDTQELILTGYEENQTRAADSATATIDKPEQLDSGSYAATGPAQARHIIMANQLLPWNFGQLTISEVAHALFESSQWVENTFINTGLAPKQKDIQKLEAICLLHVMLFTSSSFERARTMLVLTPRQQNEDAALAYILDDAASDENETLRWRIRAIHPDYKTTHSVSEVTERKRTDFFTLPDVAGTAKYIQLLWQHLHSQPQQPKISGTRDYRLFSRHQPETMRTNLRRLLAELDPTGRLTETKLTKFLFDRIVSITDGDVCAASMIAGEEHMLAHVRLFYSMIPISSLQFNYIHATRQISAHVHHATGKTFDYSKIPDAEDSDRYVGSRLCPTLKAVKAAVSSLHESIEEARTKDDFMSYHNLYTLLALWRFSFATAVRAIDTPYLALSEIDLDTGIGLLSDKDDGTGYKSRLIWIPPFLIRQMKQYQKHCTALIKRFPDLVLGKDQPIFFLKQGQNDRMKPVPVRPSTMQPFMQEFLPYPANFHRRFMRTELLGRYCPAEVVDAWMGHWNLGEEPWSMYSSFSYQSYRNSLLEHLFPVLAEIGLAGITMVKDDPDDPDSGKSWR